MKRRQTKIGPVHHSSEDYRKVYLKSNHWKQLRAIKRSKNPACQICGRGKNPDVHHLFYGELYNVRLDWLVTLCRKCHTEVHRLKLTYDPDFQWFSGPCRKNRERYETMEQMFLDKVHDRLKKKSKKSKSKPKRTSSVVLGEDVIKQINRKLPTTNAEQRAILKFVSKHRSLFDQRGPKPPKQYLGKKCLYRKEHKESLRRIQEQKLLQKPQ